MKHLKMFGLVVVLCLVASVVSAEYVPVKVELNLLERLVAGMLLPKETSFANWKILNDIKNQLALTEEETKLLDMQPAENGSVIANWDVVVKEVTFGEVAEKWIVDALKELDRKEKLLPEQLSLYEKFIIKGEE